MPTSPYLNIIQHGLARAMAEDQATPQRSSTPGAFNGNAPPSPASPSASASASPVASQGGGNRVKIKLNTKSPLKVGARGLSNGDEAPQIKFIPGPNSNAPRNYDDLPDSETTAEYIAENKAHLAKLVAFENDGWKARIDFGDTNAPKHTPVEFEYESEEDQKALNDMLFENYCLRSRVQCIIAAKRQWGEIYPCGAELAMRMYKQHRFFVAFPS